MLLTKLLKPLLGPSRHNAASSSSWQLAAKHLDPKQLDSYHNEQLIRVDQNDSVLGPISKGQSHAIETVKSGIYHRALSLLIFDCQDKFLLTQRASSKITFPDYYTNACCSHPLYTQLEIEEDGHAIGVRRATVRRANFELGIHEKDLHLSDLKLVNKLAYRAESDGGQWGEAEVDYVFIIRRNFELKPNPDEVRSYRYVSKEEMREIIDNNSLKITPWVRLMAKEFLFKYWDNLDQIDAIAQPDNIINYEQLIE